MGPRCAAKGAVQLWPQLAQAVRDSPDLRKRVMLLQTSCQYPCNHGPLMIVYPDGVWYGPMDADNMVTTLKGHVLHDRVNAERHVHGPVTLKRP